MFLSSCHACSPFIVCTQGLLQQCHVQCLQRVLSQLSRAEVCQSLSDRHLLRHCLWQRQCLSKQGVGTGHQPFALLTPNLGSLLNWGCKRSVVSQDRDNAALLSERGSGARVKISSAAIPLGTLQAPSAVACIYGIMIGSP